MLLGGLIFAVGSSLQSPSVPSFALIILKRLGNGEEDGVEMFEKPA
jgi:hypothetical protein